MRPLRRLCRRAALLVAVVSVLGSGQVALAAEYEAQIINGTVVSTQPWQSTVYLETDEWACTGSLIAPTWVLTAAHCIDGRATIYAGAVDPRHATFVTGATGVRHPGYDDDEFVNDVGLYRLDAAHPTTLPDVEVATADQVSLWAPGTPLEVFGWGIDETGSVSQLLKTATLDSWPARDCEAAAPDAFDETSMICMFRPGVSTCAGDSGGPVVRNRSGRLVLVGVTSWGPATCGSFAVAAGGSALGWIHQHAFGTSPPSRRLADVDRFGTAAAISRAGWDHAQTVYVTTGRNFPDALAAGPAAAAAGAPLLLVEPTSVPAVTAAELRRLQPAELVLVGGTAAIADSVAAQLRAATGAVVRRVAGVDRYRTATAAMADTFPQGTRDLYVATGRSFEDALMAGAAAARVGAALLLVDGTTGPEPHVLEAARSLVPSRITLVGAPGTISAAVRSALQSIAPVTVVDAADVPTRSAALWTRTRPGVPAALLATSSAFADGLAGAPYAALVGGALLVVPPTCVPRSSAGALTDLAPGGIVLLGGTAALSPAVASLTPC